MLRIAPLIIFALLAFVLSLGLFSKSTATIPLSPLIGTAFPAIDLPRVDNPNILFTRADIVGYPALINLYASWCAPCKAEHPLLMQLANQNLIRIYGIAWRDSGRNVTDLLQKMGNPYQITALDERGKVTVELGLGGVPETYLLDQAGIIRAKYTGPLTADIISDEIIPMIHKMQANHAP